MHYIIAGGTGFIGQALVEHFLAKGISISVIGRDVSQIQACYQDKVAAIAWDELNSLDLQVLEKTYLIINLAGANIGAGRWTQARRQEILRSRIETTQQLSELCAKLGKDAPALFNASGISVYGLQEQQAEGLAPPYDEQTPIDFHEAPDFMSEVGRSWEYANHTAREASIRVVNMRFGVVLGPNGGALEKISQPFHFFIGGTIGSGKQAFSWISLTDLIRAIDFLIARPEFEGPINFVSPGCVTQQTLAQTLGKILNKPSLVPTPAFVLQLAFGDMAKELLLEGQHVVPQRLLDAGFEFNHPTIDSALRYCFPEQR